MYVHQHQLEHLLEPRHYTDPAFFRREVETIFEPGWHLVGTRAQLPRPGDFRTAQLFDRQVILRNTGDRIQAYANVCAHRHSRLTGLACGNMPKLRCQYHGWEYDDQGRTNRIPEARCFRPFDRENAHLQMFPTETAGDLIFVSFADDPPDFRDSLSGHYDLFAESFGGAFRHCWTGTFRFRANWKVPVENTLEAYHIPCLHPNTLTRSAEEETCTHLLGADSTTLHTHEYLPFARMAQNWMVRRLGRPTTNIYTHHHVHPNLVYIGTDAMRLAEVFLPVSESETEQHVLLYAVRGFRKNPLARAVAATMSYFVRSVTRRIQTEDVVIFENVQLGLRASRHKGVIGSMEERINAFQKYTLTKTSEAPLH